MEKFLYFVSGGMIFTAIAMFDQIMFHVATPTWLQVAAVAASGLGMAALAWYSGRNH